MTRLIAAAALTLAAFLAAPVAATPQLPCSAQSARLVQMCDGARCVAVSPRSVCRAAIVARRAPRLEETAVSVQERGRRELDALIAGLN